MAFDLDKVIAEGANSASKKKPFDFTFDGNTYTLPNEIDVLAIASAADGDLLGALRRLLQADQFEKIKTSSVVFTGTAMSALLDAYFTHVSALTVGESSASTRSSKSTARPSKPTSKRTTKSRSLRSVPKN